MAKKFNDKTKKKEKNHDRTSDEATVQHLMETIQNLQKEKEILRHEALKSQRAPTGRIGIVLLVVGALMLAGSVVRASLILAFIGLGVTFWGVLFLFVRPIKFVRSTLLNSTAISSYTTMDRMIQDLNYSGKPIYIPPYPKEAYLPEYLKGLKEMIVFIPAEDTLSMPTVEEMARKQFLLKNPKGICIAPPGNGLINLFEKELRTEFTQINLERLQDSLPNIIVKNLELAKEFEINQENDLIHIRLVKSAYKELYSRDQGFKSIHTIGCPITSAIACALAKTTAKLVTITKDSVSYDLDDIEVWYQTQRAYQ
jgi:hypothetical protein